MRRAVFLDRDGVLNRACIRDGKPYPPRSLAEVELYPGVAGALLRLRQRGYVLVVVTNQPDVARGTLTLAEVEAVHAALRAALPLDEILVCPHDDKACCTCRKPGPGMLLEAAARWEVDLKSSYMVGDRWRDVEAGRRAGCTTVFVQYGYQERQPEAPDAVVATPVAALEWILSRDHGNM